MHPAIKEIQNMCKRSDAERELVERWLLTEKEVEAIKKSACSNHITYAGPDVKFRVSAIKVEILCDMVLAKYFDKQLDLFELDRSTLNQER